MNIGLLSKMIRELLLEHDEVGLPGLGAFVAEFVPASFTDRGYVINPPYRRVVFLPGKGNDGLLTDLYSNISGLDKAKVNTAMERFLADLKAELIERKTVVFPGLGRLRATKQNNFFFISDEDLDIYPEGFGLESVSLKNHTPAPAPAVDDVQPLASIVTTAAEPAIVTSAEEPVVEPVLEPAAEPVVEPAVKPAGESVPEPAVELAVEPAEVQVGVDSEAPEAEPIVIPVEPEDEPIVEPAAEPVAPTRLVEPTVPAQAEEAEPVALAQQEEPAAAQETEASESVPKAKRRFRWWLLALVLVLLAGISLAVFLILAQVAPDFIDSLLYTPEELRILNW